MTASQCRAKQSLRPCSNSRSALAPYRLKRKSFMASGGTRERFRDDLIRVWVDAPDLPEHRRFFADFKERLKADFKQLDIWMTTYPIDVV
jgi:hypothetical protein